MHIYMHFNSQSGGCHNKLGAIRCNKWIHKTLKLYKFIYVKTVMLVNGKIHESTIGSIGSIGSIVTIESTLEFIWPDK